MHDGIPKYVMFSENNFKSRYRDLIAETSDEFIVVRFDDRSGWQYSTDIGNSTNFVLGFVFTS